MCRVSVNFCQLRLRNIRSTIRQLTEKFLGGDIIIGNDRPRDERPTALVSLIGSDYWGRRSENQVLVTEFIRMR